MTRGFGEFELLAGLPDWVVVLAVVLTQLGDVWFVLLLLGVLYWFGESLPGPQSLDRTRGAFAVALAVGALTLTTALKGWLAFPRPPGADDPTSVEFLPPLLQGLYSTGATASGFAFPSGHAVAAMVVYGGLAYLIRSRRVTVLASGVVVVVALTRVVLGVHYLVDVLVGLAVGGAYLGVVLRGAGGGSNPMRAFHVAVGFAVVGVALGGYTEETMAALGGTLGATLAWYRFGLPILGAETTPTGGLLAAVFGLACLGLSSYPALIDPAPWAVFLVSTVVLGGYVAAPLVGERAARRLTDAPTSGSASGGPSN